MCYMQIKYRNMTPEAALDHARSVRPRVLLAPAQWEACNLTLTIFYCIYASVTQSPDLPPRDCWNIILLSFIQAVKTFSTLSATYNARYLSIESSNLTCSALSYEESSEHSSMLTSRCHSPKSSDEDSVTSDEESSEASVADPEVYGYATTEFDSEHFVLPRCGSMLSRPTSPTRCSDLVFITEADLEGYESFTDVGEDDVEDEVEVVVRHKPIMRKLSFFLGSLKLTSNCQPPPSRLTEVRAC